ncbi:MAG: calcium/sodium antiporter [Bacilli bacterium]|nr:calcium/sodium antiporter [Bacilli bacterium]
MVLQILILVMGFIILVKGADLFVDAASSLAQNFHISKMLIALTIVSFGTSAPEFAVSIKSIISGNTDILLGNVIGSNILNILLILGVSSCIHSLTVKNSTVKKELPITILITTLFIVLISDKWLTNTKTNLLTRSDGITILLFFSIFIYYLFTIMRNKTSSTIDDEKPKYGIAKSMSFTVVGIVCLILGSNAVVDSASSIAKILGVSERVISLTIIALGTSLPELVTSVVATKKKEYDIAIGNVVGSNIFNIGIVIGLPIALFGGIASVGFTYIDLLALFIATLMLFIFCFRDYKISRKEGITFLIMFLIYYLFLFIK